MAVYTHIDKEALTQHLAAYDIGTLVSFDGIAAGVSNTNYKIVTTKGSFILTIFEPRTETKDLPFFISFMDHLKERGIPCPGVISARDGRSVLPLAGKASLVTTFLEGKSAAEPRTSQVASVGMLLARMHKAAESFLMWRKNTMALPEWHELIEDCHGKTDLFPFLHKELNYLDNKMPRGLPGGAIHADLFPDNVFFTSDRVTGVIDFYFACHDAFAYDLMLTFNAWCFEGGIFSREKAVVFLEAYQRERPLTGEEGLALSTLGRAAALRIVATRLYDQLHQKQGAVVTVKDPLEYIEILKFHQQGTWPI